MTRLGLLWSCISPDQIKKMMNVFVPELMIQPREPNDVVSLNVTMLIKGIFLQ